MPYYQLCSFGLIKYISIYDSFKESKEIKNVTF